MSIIGCAGSDEPGANFTPPTLGEFMHKQALESKRLREAKAGQQVIKEAREFHEHQANRYGIHTNRGLAHFRASKMFTREGNRLQEMFDQGGQDHSELPPKAVMKASKAAMLFHKKQAEKAGLDSDLGHAHVAAMEHHADIHKKAKQQHQQSQTQQQPMQASAEGGPGSGPQGKNIGPKRKGPVAHVIELMKKYPMEPIEKTGQRISKIFGISHEDAMNYVIKASKQAFKGHGMEALPGHGSKQSPVPVPKKSEQPSEDVRDPNKPPVQLNPQDANKPMRRLQQNEADEGGPGSGPRSRGGKAPRSLKAIKREIASYYNLKNMSPERRAELQRDAVKEWKAQFKSKKKESRVSAIANFGRESGKHVRRGPDDGMERSDPKGAGTLMDDDLVYRGPRTKQKESVEGGPGSGRHKGAEHHYAKAKEYEEKRDSAWSQAAQDRYNDKANEHYKKAYDLEHYGKSSKESRRSLRRPIWETDDSERDRSDSGLTA